MKTKTAPMIQVGATKFARNSAALVSSLFDPTGTASGLYSVRRNGIMFSLPSGEPFAFLVANKHDERFFVTCSRQDDGRVRYMFGLSDPDCRRLGLAAFGHIAQHDEAARIWKELSAA